eukprot:gene1668-1411_t
MAPIHSVAGWLLAEQVLPRLHDPDPLARESAVLAVGAIGGGLFYGGRRADALRPKIPELLLLLFVIIGDAAGQQQFYTRAMACKREERRRAGARHAKRIPKTRTGRFCAWIVERAYDDDA